MTIERWRTVDRSDPDFVALLRGSAPGLAYRALPRRSLNVGGEEERVTFEIVPLDEIERPNALAIALHSLRPETLVLSLGPLLAALAHLTLALGKAVDFGFAAFAVCGVLLFHASINLLNDYVDHMSGADRVNSIGGSRAIQRGWARASDFRAWGLALLSGAFVCGAGIASQKTIASIPVGACALGAAYYLTWGKSSSRRRAGVREAAVFALGGPLLTSGFIASASENAQAALAFSTLALGAAFGFSALLYGTLGNFESLMRDSLARVGTLASRLGFDSAKKLIAASAALATATSFIYSVRSGFFPWLAPMVAAVALTCWRAARAAIQAPSPLSSALRGARNRALYVHWALAAGSIAGLVAASFL